MWREGYSKPHRHLWGGYEFEMKTLTAQAQPTESMRCLHVHLMFFSCELLFLQSLWGFSGLQEWLSVRPSVKGGAWTWVTTDRPSVDMIISSCEWITPKHTVSWQHKSHACCLTCVAPLITYCSGTLISVANLLILQIPSIRLGQRDGYCRALLRTKNKQRLPTCFLILRNPNNGRLCGTVGWLMGIVLCSVGWLQWVHVSLSPLLSGVNTAEQLPFKPFFSQSHPQYLKLMLPCRVRLSPSKMGSWD